MPIRFRCPSCTQLLGIARRKANTAVECPTCHAQVVVPAEDQPDLPSPDPAAPPAPFERDDFDAYLRPPPGEVPGGRAAPVLAPAPWPAPAPLELGRPPPPVPGPEVVPAPVRPDGIFVSPARATVLTVAMILLLALAFGAGLLIGRFL